MLPSRRLAPPDAGTTPRAGLGTVLVRHQAAISLLIYAAAAGIVCIGAWRTPATAAVGNSFDLPLCLWFLRWYPHALAHGQPLLVSDSIDYPGGVNLMWNTSIPLLGVLLSPATLAAGPVVALNLLTTLAPALSAWTAFLALRRYVLRPAAAAVGGAVFGFSPYLMTQSLGHPQVAFAALVPLIFMTLDEALVRQRPRALPLGIALGMLAAAQLLIGEEVLVISGITAVIGIIVLIAVNRGDGVVRVPYAARAVGTAAVTFALLAAYPAVIQLFGPDQPQGPLQPASIYQTDLLGLVIPTARQLLAPGPAVDLSRHFSGPLENGSYLGLPLIALTYWMARRQWSRPVVRWAVLLTITIVVLSMGFSLRLAGVPAGLPMPWSLVGWAPVLDHVLPARMMGPAFLTTGLLLALFTDQALRSALPSQRRFGLAVSGLVLVALLPQPLPATLVAAPSFFTTAAVNQITPDSVALVAPFAQALTGSDAMGWQAQSGLRFRMPSGYAYGPNWLSPPPSRLQTAMVAIQLYGDRPQLQPRFRQQLLAELHRWNVQTVIVGPMDNQPAMLDFLTQLIGRPAVSTGGVYVWWRVDQLT